MSNNVRSSEIRPANGVPFGEIEILLENARLEKGSRVQCFANGVECRIVAASSRRVLAVLPDLDDSSAVIQVEIGGEETKGTLITLGKRLVDGMHIVANPAIDPKDDALVMTRSGSRGQQLPNTLYRLETDGYLDELPVEILNPTGIAFGPDGTFYATDRANGTVCRIERGEEAIIFASDMGIATGLAFDEDGVMFVGDRSGTIFRVEQYGHVERFASIEASVAAFHLAFGPSGDLFVSSPGFASHDAIYSIDPGGNVRTFVRGLGRPQGIAFDKDGYLYAAACTRGRHGVVRIEPETRRIEHFVAGTNLVGLCFTRNGEMIVASNDAVYSLNLGIYGTLLKER